MLQKKQKRKRHTKMESKQESKSSSPQLHLLDFSGLWETLQVLLERQHFGVFLLQDGYQVVQESDVPANRDTLRRTDLQGSERVKRAIYRFYYVRSDMNNQMDFHLYHIPCIPDVTFIYCTPFF